MKNIIRIEEVAITTIAIYFISMLNLPFTWWMYILLFFAPDVSIAGYLINNKVGAITYNLLHHRALALAIVASGMYLALPDLTFVGAMLFAHASFDRIFGYGLKYFAGFRHTHLGQIDK